MLAALCLAAALYQSTVFVVGIVGDAIRNSRTGEATENRAMDLILACLLWGAYTLT
jgi:ribosome biogenesis SPOUT family RNA methylase Rps3